MEDHRMAQWLDATIVNEGTKIQDLAKQVGVTASQISKWKSGEQPLKRPEHIFKIAEFYGIDPMRLLATADESFQEQGFDPLPIPEVEQEHLLTKLPRYIGDRERKLMGRIVQLGASVRAEPASSTAHIEKTFDAIDEMLDTVQEMVTEEHDDSGATPRGQSGGGGEAGSAEPSSRGSLKGRRRTGKKPGGRSGGLEASFGSPLPGAVVFGW